MYEAPTAPRSPIALIEQAKGERWDLVDEGMRHAVEDRGYVTWAMESGVRAQHAGVRALAAVMLFHCTVPLSADCTEYLLGRIGREPGVRAKYYMAFALWRHGSRSDLVRQLMQEAERDQEYQDIVLDTMHMFPDVWSTPL